MPPPPLIAPTPEIIQDGVSGKYYTDLLVMFNVWLCLEVNYVNLQDAGMTYCTYILTFILLFVFTEIVYDNVSQNEDLYTAGI